VIDDEHDRTPLPDAMMERLRTESPHSAAVEERTIRRLRSAGILATPKTQSAARWPRIGMQAAAAVLLFTAGMLVDRRVPARGRTAASSSLDVQEAGTAYVAALVRLSQAAHGEQPHNLVAGLEAGTATLHAAAVSLSRIDPGDPVVRRIRTSLDAAAMSGSSDLPASGDSSIIRF
jgi:hypothetical protein